AAVSSTDYLNAKKKFQAIDRQTVKAGSKVAVTAHELNAYVQTELPKVVPVGVRDPNVELVGNNTATGKVMVDFLKLRSARGKSTSWIMRKLLEGEREVEVTARVSSGYGKATVYIDRVEVSGIPIEGTALDFLINNYLIPNYPEAKIGRPFELHKRVDRIEVSPGVAYVFTR
ncbi:MAG TPA: hypothetical protein VEX68_01095, partial [Bryobacteraceae bacterium]|nr:hypothetical protein [Bryobacteraceae bacterium]